MENMSKYDYECNKCGYVWKAKKKKKPDTDPKCCPRCKSYDWNKKG